MLNKSIATVALSLLVIAGCGGGGSSSSASNSGGSSSPAAIKLMGGSMQGRALNLTGAETTIAGSINILYGWADGPGTLATFRMPNDITTDGTSLFVADDGNANIRKIDIAIRVVSTLAGPDSSICSTNMVYVAGVTGPMCPFGQADGVGKAARFLSPSSITTDGTYLYVGDQQLIRKIVIATGEVTTLAGSVSGYLDGIGKAAQFSYISSITTDGTNLYVADALSIRKVVIATGDVSTIAGGGASGTAGNVDGIGSVARFGNTLHGLTTDGVSLYLADYFNSSIRKIDIATGTVSTLATGLGKIQGLTSDGTSLYTSDATAIPTTKKIDIASGAVSTLARPFSWPVTASPVNGITTDGNSLYIASSIASIIDLIQ